MAHALGIGLAKGIAVFAAVYFYLAQRRRTRDLAESETMLTNVFEATPFPLLIIGREDGVIRRANRSAHRLFGTASGGLRGTRAPERCADPGAREALSRLVAEHGRIEDFELAVDGGDGARWVKLSASPINFDGEECLIVELDDITGHKNLETAQQELLDAVPLPLILSHAETHEFIRLNTRALEMYGLQAEEIGEHKASEFYIDPLVRNELIERLRRDGFVDEYETCLQTPTGPQWMTASGRFLRYGGQDAVLVTHAPINTRKRLETALQEREAQLRIIFDKASDAIISFAEDGSLLAFNKAAERMFGRPANAIANLRMEMLFPSQPRGSGRTIWPVNHERLGLTVESEARYADGTLFPVEVSISEMWLGEQHMYSGIIRDITERRQVEQMKREFISTVSHELRTPLTSIGGSLGLVMGGVAGELPPKAKQLLGIAHKNCERLVRLINDILDLEKAEAGKLDFDGKQVPLAPLCE
ncbi:MAG: PAS domain S-box protein, partial [Alphaproteobacteria bacterium]